MSALTREELDEAASWFTSAWEAPQCNAAVAIWADTYGPRLLAAARAGLEAEAKQAELQTMLDNRIDQSRLKNAELIALRHQVEDLEDALNETLCELARALPETDLSRHLAERGKRVVAAMLASKNAATADRSAPDEAEAMFAESNAAYAALRADPDAWAAELAERRLWDVTLADGLDDEDAEGGE